MPAPSCLSCLRLPACRAPKNFPGQREVGLFVRETFYGEISPIWSLQPTPPVVRTVWVAITTEGRLSSLSVFAPIIPVVYRGTFCGLFSNGIV
jgi:hypothetical protein